MTAGKQPFRVEMRVAGLLEDLQLAPAERRPPRPEEVEIQVDAVGLNFREVMKALGVYPGLPDTLTEENNDTERAPLTFDGDCVGKVSAIGRNVEGIELGDKVIGCGPAVFGSFATVPRFAVARMPARLSSEEAATIPAALLTAYYTLHRLARVRQGERVLIHAATGGVGLAAVQLCQIVGAEIFATAGRPEKRSYLKSLGVQHVFDSRSLDFADEVMHATDGQGVDIVLNSLAGLFMARSLDVVAKFGRFLEIGRTDIYQNKTLELYPFRNNLSFFAVDLQQLDPVSFAALFDEVMQYFEKHNLRPLPHSVFPVSDVVSAFRYMRRAKHIGKIVVSLSDQAVAPDVSGANFRRGDWPVSSLV